jgi:glutamate racemase
MATKNKKIGILGTDATINSASFEKAILALDPTIEVTATPCPLFVSLVESGWIQADDDVAIPMVRRYLAEVKAAGVDTLILGCTHFPLLSPIIQKELGDHVTLIDSGRETAAACAQSLKDSNSLAQISVGTAKYFVSDQPEGFSQVAEIFLGQSVEQSVEMVRPGRRKDGCQ